MKYEYLAITPKRALKFLAVVVCAGTFAVSVMCFTFYLFSFTG